VVALYICATELTKHLFFRRIAPQRAKQPLRH
jgi:hypothetical protein